MPPRAQTDAPPGAAPGDEFRPDPKRWSALSVTLVVGFMTLLDVSIVSVALPSLQTDLGATPATVQWVVSGYALTFGLVLVPAGRLGDALGRRRLFLVGLAGFVLSSATMADGRYSERIARRELAHAIAAYLA